MDELLNFQLISGSTESSWQQPGYVLSSPKFFYLSPQLLVTLSE